VARKKKHALPSPVPGAAEIEHACRTGPAQIEDLIARLQTIAAAAPGVHVVMSKDGEGNDFSPLFQITLGVYRARDSWHGDVGEPAPGGTDVNAVVLWPMS
jgi:hypothetical protein